MTLDEFRAILDQVQFGDWEFHVGLDGTRPYLQIRFRAPDNVTGETDKAWSGRKWFLSPHMTHSEVVLTALKAVMTAVEHETREKFLYRGRAILGPHIDVDAMWEAATTLDERKAA